MAQTSAPCTPSRNSTKSLIAAGSQRSRSRPATYPPRPKLASAVNNKYTPDATANAGDASRQVGDDETTESPIAVPNAIRTSETAEATKAPAMTALHWTKDVVTSTATEAAGAGAS